MNKAVIYARYSSDKQSEQSIEGQLRACYQFALDNNYIVVNTYIDRAVTGRNDDRVYFQAMLKNSYQNEFDAVIVYRFDRFARNRYDSAVNKALLRKNGVKVMSAMEQINDSPEGIILESMLEGYAEYYSAELSQKVRRGNLESIEKGQSIGGTPLLGYSTVNKKRVVNPDEAILVRKIFDMYASGHKGKEIVAEIGLVHPTTYNSILTILKNKKYTGVYTFKGKDYFDAFPRIIDDDTFAKVQRRIERNKKSPAQGRATNYFLTNKMYCQCGEPMTGHSGTSRNKKLYHYYICKNNHRTPKEWIESLVLSLTQKHILKKSTLNPLITNILKVYNESLKDNPELRILEKELVATKKSIDNLMNAIKLGFMNETSQMEMLRLETQKNELEFSILKTKNENHYQLTREMILFWFEQFRASSSESSRAKIFDIFISKVQVYDDKIIIAYNHSGDNTSEIDLSECSRYSTMVRHNVSNTNIVVENGYLILIFYTNLER